MFGISRTLTYLSHATHAAIIRSERRLLLRYLTTVWCFLVNKLSHAVKGEGV